MELWLRNALVVKHFGITPNKGRRIRGHTIRSACGIRLKQAWGKGTEYIPHEMTVDMVISLHWIRGNNQDGLWCVKATQGYEEIALNWIMENCQIQPDKPAKRRSIKHRAHVVRWGHLPIRVDNG